MRIAPPLRIELRKTVGSFAPSLGIETGVFQWKAERVDLQFSKAIGNHQYRFLISCPENGQDDCPKCIADSP